MTTQDEIEGQNSSSAIAIRVTGLSKVFPIYAAPRDRLKQFVMPRLRRWVGAEPKQYHRDFWALREVDLTVRRGETVGIIGRNGAGKSTLLQIICGTLSPTSGTVTAHGRIAALLELGAGFNPEFTGRENVYLNGAILGLSRAEVDSRFEEIAAFADIGDFLDQPVKTYSSGMYVRLAFAVQACVEPEILIVDEALSVGDIGFQYKCFKRMEALRAKGVTILMVTHSTGSILEYADRCVVLDGGRVAQDTTDVLAAVLAYEKGMLAHQRKSSQAATQVATQGYDLNELRAIQARTRNVLLGEKRFGTARAIIDDLSLFKADGAPLDAEPMVRSGEEIIFRFRLLAAEALNNVVLGVSLSKTQGGDVWGDNNLNAGVDLDLQLGARCVEYRVRLPLSAGEYLVHAGLARFAADDREELDQRRPTARLRVWSPRAQVGVVHAPIQVDLVDVERA
jgi:lipopolysaccharide transport system ATP-binding protein